MANVASPGSPLFQTMSLDAERVDAPSFTRDAKRAETPSSTKDAGKKNTPCPFCVGVFVDRASYIEHLVNYHRVDWERYSVLANARKNSLATCAPVSRVRKRAATPIAIRLKEQPCPVPQLVPEVPKFKELNDPKLGCVVISLDDDDELEPQATAVMGMKTDQADASEALKPNTGELIDTADSIAFDHDATQPTTKVVSQQEALYTGSAIEPPAFASSELQGSKQFSELGEQLSIEKPQQPFTRPVNDGQEQLCSQSEAIICSASSSSEPHQIDIAEPEAAVPRVEDTIAVTQPPEAVVQSTVIVPRPSETVLKSHEASPAAQAVPLQGNTQAEESTIINVDILVGAQLSEPATSTLGEPVELGSRPEISASAITLNVTSAEGPPNRKKISLSSYRLKKTREMEPTRGEGPPPVSQGDDQHTAKLKATGDGLYTTELQAMTAGANAEETITSVTDLVNALLETQSPTPPHNHGSPSTEAVDPQTTTKIHESTNINELDLDHGNRTLVKFKFAPLVKILDGKLKEKRVPVTKPDVTEKILGKTIVKPDKQTLVLETANEGNGQLKTVTTYSKFQPGRFLQNDEMFGSPEPETCGVDQEVSADAAESNTKSKVEEYPILPNPVMPQLGTGGAIASFLQSNEKDKATEWSFWGSTAVPKVKLTLVKPPIPAVQVAHNQVQSSGLREPRASILAPSGFKVVGPKPKIPLPQQDETVSSCAKAVNNLPTASTTLPIPDLNKQSNTASQPAAEVVSQRNAIFLTEDGKITTFPPGAAAASSDTYMKDTSVEMKDGERLADAQRGQESPTELVPQPFVARLRELEDIQYDTQKSERRYDGVEHKARDVDKNTSLDGVVGGQLPVALRCPECLRFHHGRCSRPSQPCILCGGQHWVKQCNCRSLRLAKTYRPGISCTRCRFMHKNKCPTADACPICLRIHKGLCLKPSGTCRYCGKEHWENSCPRWEQLDEEMGFFVEPEEGKALKAADMAGRVARFWDPDAPYFDKLKTKLLEEIDIEPGECITQDDFLKVVSKRDELRRLPPTYANAKAVKRDVMSTLLGKNGSGFAYARPRDGAYRDHSPIHRGNEMKRGYCDFDRDYDRDYHLYDDTESRRGRGFGMYRVRDSRSDYRSKYAHGARETKGKTLDRNETRDDRNQGVYYQNHDDLPTKSNRESAESGPSVLQPSTDPATIRSRRDELWGRDRKGVEMEKIVGIYADLKAREARLEEQIKEREKEEKGKRNNEGRDWAKSKPGGSRDLSEPRRRFGKRGESNKRAPSVSSLRGKTVDDGLEKWGDSDLYSKRRRNE